MEKQFYSEQEAIDLLLGQKGSAVRDKYEEDVAAFLMGEMIRKARQAKNMTQEELGELIGVKKAQISRIERGYNSMTLTTVSKVMNALEMSVILDMGTFGRVKLCG